MPMYYFSCSKGCGIRQATGIRQARSNIIREVGEYDMIAGPNILRLASKKDIAWVKAMGGYIPKIEKEK